MYPDYNMYNGFGGYNDYNFNNYRAYPNNQMTSGEIITLNEAIDLIRKSVGNEKEDEIFYQTLIDSAPDEKAKEIIISIRDDERKHNQILRGLYYKFTGQMLPQDTLTTATKTGNYKEDLEKALFGELEAVVKYRKIMGAMPDDESYTLIMSIMTDELRHANKYNYLIHKAK